MFAKNFSCLLLKSTLFFSTAPVFWAKISMMCVFPMKFVFFTGQNLMCLISVVASLLDPHLCITLGQAAECCCMDGWMDGCMHACMDGCMHACMDGWMDR